MTSNSEKLTIFDLSTRSIRSPSLSLSSNNSSFNINNHKKRFDDRSTTKTSLALKNYRSNSYQQTLEKKSSTQSNKLELISIYSWSDLKKISFIITSSEFISKYGSVLLVNTNSIFIAVGTSHGQILIFNYKQEIASILFLPEDEEQNEVSCMSFSSDCTFFIAGYKDGTIRLWDLNNGPVILPNGILPYFTIYPLESVSSTKNGHLINKKITYVSFIQSQTHQFISIDESSLILHHTGVKKLINTYFTSEQLLKINDPSRNELQLKILNYGMLPMGSSNQITDGMGVLALMTQDTLTILSTTSLNDPSITRVIPYFKVGKSKESGSIVTSTAMSWFPCVKTLDGISNAKLAYSWNNVLGILELDNHLFPNNLIKIVNDAKDKDKAIPKLPFSKTCKWDTKSNIIDIKWIQSNMLSVFVGSDEETKMITFFYDNKSLTPIAEDFFTSEIKQINSSKQCFIMLNESKLSIGRQLSWADILLTNISHSNYSEALDIADEFYNTTSKGKLVAVGLPIDKNKRAAIIRPYLIEIMKEALPHLNDHLTKYLDIISYTGYTDILESLLEYSNDNQRFFQTLEPFILSEFITILPPVVLKRLVEYYATNEMGDLLTELLCTLDIKSLDIDVTIQLCKKYNLRECLIFIWNSLLNDYETPLLDFLNDFQNSTFLQSEEHLKAYDYISFILTGRQYPTERYISNGEFDAIKSLCDILFSSGSVTRNGQIVHALDDNTIFPYLYTFLQIDSFLTLSALNEFFESSFLNDQPKYNRQFLIEALLDLYNANESKLNNFDKCQLSIFIARNYPKYSQFIRLSESTLDSIIDNLCSNSNNEIFQDCELALQSLLQKYLPDDENFIDKLKLAGFYNVLVDFYNSEGKYSMALEMWLQKDENEEDDYVSHLMNLIDQSFAKNQDAKEKIKVVKVLRNKFSSFLKSDTDLFYKLIDKYASQLHSEVLFVQDDLLKFNYLQKLFQESKLIKLDNFLFEYLRLLIKFNRSKVLEFTEYWKSTLIKSDYDQVIDLLRNNQVIDGQACLFAYSKEYSKAIDTIIDNIQQILDQITESNQENFIHLINYAMTIIETPETYDISIDEEEMSLNEKLWLNLLNSLVNLANITTDENTHNFINRCIHDCFKKISDYKLNSPKGEQSFLKIFTIFLQTYSNDQKQIATLSNIKGILQEVFISYSYESEMLKISLKMLNDDFYKNMLLIKDNHQRGWIINGTSCYSCGQLICGSKLSEEIIDQHQLALENKEYKRIILQSTNEVDEKFHYLDLIFFGCGHSYHSICLEKLNSPKTCILCK
ncbi:VPS8 [Candida jiufengensis]|uniref:VPS8 n=1 Tax=Candida jiufengensis TaxID=497108 RepID=UPI0022252252|nr:VPS8 [Candida jiufengensis]KAI5953193.1 VPS8 [Candida jiufengensis]